MRTVIFVYQSTPVTISTYESDVELCCMDGGTESLSQGDHARTVAPGVYKLVSSQEVKVTGDTSAFEVVVVNSKTNDPTPPSLAIVSLSSADLAALQTFLAIPDAKVMVNP